MNKYIIGALGMLVVILLIAGGIFITLRLDRISKAHDNLVYILRPVIEQLVSKTQNFKDQNSKNQTELQSKGKEEAISTSEVPNAEQEKQISK